jgi:hypothetical protein
VRTEFQTGFHPLTKADMEAAISGQRELAAFLTTKSETQQIQVIDEHDQPHSIVLPTSAIRLLVDVLIELGEGNAVKVIPIHAELATQEAADLLNVSRPHIVKLIEQGALDEMTRQTQELGMGYE